MKQTLVKCSCDKCNMEMTEWEYEKAPKVTIRIDVPHPDGKCGECNAIEMKICNKCATEVGIIPTKIHNGLIDARGRIKRVLEDNKIKLFNMFFKKI